MTRHNEAVLSSKNASFLAPLDLKHIKSYVESAETPEAWEAYKATYLSGTQANYVDAVGGADAIGAIAKPVY